MVRTVAAEDLGDRAKDLLTSTRGTSEPILIQEDGKTVGVMITVEEYEKWREARRARAWEAIQRVKGRNADKDPDEEMAFITEVVEEVRRELYERDQQPLESRD
jgi:PHD/YefM family antitoxin component YafN of YafNO toxin-antitoxin module